MRLEMLPMHGLAAASPTRSLGLPTHPSFAPTIGKRWQMDGPNHCSFGSVFSRYRPTAITCTKALEGEKKVWSRRNRRDAKSAEGAVEILILLGQAFESFPSLSLLHQDARLKCPVFGLQRTSLPFPCLSKRLCRPFRGHLRLSSFLRCSDRIEEKETQETMPRLGEHQIMHRYPELRNVVTNLL